MPLREASIPVTDRGLAYGDGVFTTLRIAGGEPVLLHYHLQRLQGDAQAIHITPPDERQLTDICTRLTQRNALPEGVLKVIITRGPAARGPSTRGADSPTLIATVSRLPSPRAPLRAMTIPDGRGPLAAHKTLNYLPNVLALHRAEQAGCHEALFAADGLLLEAASSNIAGVVDGTLLTPPQDGRLLPGVARRRLLETGTVEEGEIPQTTEGPLYLVNSVRRVEPLAELDRRPLRQDEALLQRLNRSLIPGG